jgi:hypothetical protein
VTRGLRRGLYSFAALRLGPRRLKPRLQELLNAALKGRSSTAALDGSFDSETFRPSTAALDGIVESETIRSSTAALDGIVESETIRSSTAPLDGSVDSMIGPAEAARFQTIIVILLDYFFDADGQLVRRVMEVDLVWSVVWTTKCLASGLTS